MAFSYRIPCVECGVERVVVMDGDEASSNYQADKEHRMGRCIACEHNQNPSIEELLSAVDRGVCQAPNR